MLFQEIDDHGLVGESVNEIHIDKNSSSRALQRRYDSGDRHHRTEKNEHNWTVHAQDLPQPVLILDTGDHRMLRENVIDRGGSLHQETILTPRPDHDFFPRVERRSEVRGDEAAAGGRLSSGMTLPDMRQHCPYFLVF